MGQIINNTLSARNYKAQASIARSQGRARQAAYDAQARSQEEEARADSTLAARSMSRQRENQTAALASARIQHASSGFTEEGTGTQNELALADVFEKSLSDMALSNAISDNNKRTAAMTSRQQGRLSMMQADAQATQYNRLAKSAQNAAWIQGGVTLLSALAGGLGAGTADGAGAADPGAGAASGASAAKGTGAAAGTATAGTTLPAWLTGSLSTGQSAYDLTGALLQWSPGTVSASRDSNKGGSTNAGNALNDLLTALFAQSAPPGQ